MPLLGSTSYAAHHRYRILITALILIFIYFYQSRESNFQQILQEKDNQLHQLNLERISISENLKIIWDHKKKLANTQKSQLLELEILRERIVEKDAEILALQKSANCNRTEVLTNSEKIFEEHRKIIGNLKEDLVACERRLRESAGGNAVDHYTHNETAHFQRSHKANEPLAFDRGKIEHHLPDRLMAGNELAEALALKRADLDKHPDDRLKNEEKPDAAEQDYKEH